MKIRLLLLVSIAWAFALHASIAIAGEDQDMSVKVYRYTYLSKAEATNIAGAVCEARDTGKRACVRVESPAEGVLTVVGVPAVHAQIGALLAERDVAPRTVHFRVYVFEATKDAKPERKLPEKVERALRDVEAVLGDKHFMPSDSAELRVTSKARTTLGNGLQLDMKITSINDKSTQKVLVESFTLFDRKTSVLDTSFSLDIGETVAVGTMRTETGTLVALVTALD